MILVLKYVKIRIKASLIFISYFIEWLVRINDYVEVDGFDFEAVTVSVFDSGLVLPLIKSKISFFIIRPSLPVPLILFILKLF